MVILVKDREKKYWCLLDALNYAFKMSNVEDKAHALDTVKYYYESYVEEELDKL